MALNYGGFAKAAPRTFLRVIRCSSCGQPMTGPRSRNKGNVTHEGKVVGNRRQTDPALTGTCSNCVIGSTPRSRREWRSSKSRRARRRSAR